MAELYYRVHGVATVSRPQRVTFQGEEVDALVEGVEVDLVPVDDPTHGSITWRFAGRDARDARKEFSNGALGMLTWTPDVVEPSTAEKLEAGTVSAIAVDKHGNPI